jgi:hypothetical protein
MRQLDSDQAGLIVDKSGIGEQEQMESSKDLTEKHQTSSTILFM